MNKVLMILTSHRLDCFSLAVDMLAQGGSLARFDTVAVLCSGVKGRHLTYVEALPKRFPNTQWDFIFGERGRGKPISDMQNECVKRHPNALYFKIDEDTFVSDDWDKHIVAAYEQFRDDPRLSLITPVVTNNQRGAFHLLTSFPEFGAEFTARFAKPIIPDRMGPVWLFPQCAEFMIRRFLNLKKANQELRALKQEPFIAFSYPFSINCICYDYRHWLEIGGVPEEDENGWGKWIPEHDKIIVLATQSVLHHYSFFVQQNWLDRSTLLEDIRAANLPDTIQPLITRKMNRFKRIVGQLPSVLARKLGRTKG